MIDWQSISTATAAPDTSVDDPEELLHQRIIQTLNEARIGALDDAGMRRAVDQVTRRLISAEFPQYIGDAKEDLVARLVDEVTGLGPIEFLRRDPSVSEIMVNGPDEIYYERNGLIEESAVRFKNRRHVMRIIDRITTALGRHVDEASPMVDARLADGSRVNVIIPPLVPENPVITIRKFRTDLHAISELVQIGTLSPPMADFLAACVRAKINTVISGGTGTGKTTLLNAVSAFIPLNERIITIEDPLEMQLQQKHTVRMEARPPSTEGTGEVTQRMLLRNALRMRPDRIIIGEVRGSEAFDMMQAMNTGHEGSLTTVHANSARDALTRIESMVLMAGLELPVGIVREQMASALHFVIHLERLIDGSRKVVNISEVAGMEGPIITMQDIFLFRQEGVNEDGKVLGELRPTGLRPHAADRLKAYGENLAADMFDVQRWV